MDWLIVFCAKYLVAFVGLLTIVAIARTSQHKRLNFVAAIVLAGILAVIMDKIAGKLYYDPRPFVTHTFKPLVTHAADNGFPSEHTILAVTLSTLIYFYKRNWAVWSFVLAAAVGIGRVAALVHSPIDIAGGALIGLAAGYVGYRLSEKLIANKKSAEH